MIFRLTVQFADAVVNIDGIFGWFAFAPVTIEVGDTGEVGKGFLLEDLYPV
jgi:hypothetical protein